MCLAKAKVIVTATMVVVGDKCLPLKRNIDDALTLLEDEKENTVDHVLVWKVGDGDQGAPTLVRDIDLERVCLR